MRKMGKPVAVLFLSTLVLCFLHSSCENDPFHELYNQRPKSVSFNANGGSKVEQQTVWYGKVVVKPEDPTRSGHKFEGWYEDNGTFTKQWDFEKRYTDENDLTLHAKWIASGLTLSHETHNFGQVTHDYPAQPPLTVTVTNREALPTGDLTITISGDTNSFALSRTAIDSLGSGETATFTVTPETGLDDRTHSATITVSNNDNLSATLTVTFTVSHTEITITLNFEEIQNADLSYLGTPTISRSGTGYNKTYQVNVPSGYDNYKWEVDGSGTYAAYREEGASQNSFTLNVNNNYYNTIGGHSLMLTVRKNNLDYQVNIPFDIVD
ncbi:MAG: InlB B-repeat-containing protein [Treponema sp.]|jgi:uncharacterized repeat protein (TIGR02543 family)|nr:InlB B-repeat-containing protein [Treponema sp.]